VIEGFPYHRSKDYCEFRAKLIEMDRILTVTGLKWDWLDVVRVTRRARAVLSSGFSFRVSRRYIVKERI